MNAGKGVADSIFQTILNQGWVKEKANDMRFSLSLNSNHQSDTGSTTSSRRSRSGGRDEKKRRKKKGPRTLKHQIMKKSSMSSSSQSGRNNIRQSGSQIVEDQYSKVSMVPSKVSFVMSKKNTRSGEDDQQSVGSLGSFKRNNLTTQNSSSNSLSSSFGQFALKSSSNENTPLFSSTQRTSLMNGRQELESHKAVIRGGFSTNSGVGKVPRNNQATGPFMIQRSVSDKNDGRSGSFSPVRLRTNIDLSNYQTTGGIEHGNESLQPTRNGRPPKDSSSISSNVRTVREWNPSRPSDIIKSTNNRRGRGRRVQVGSSSSSR